MNIPIRTGGCACGAVRYELTGPFAFQLMCQCRFCQHFTGSVHSSLIGVLKSDLKITGRTTYFEYDNGEGGIRSQRFCPVCGSSVHGGNPAEEYVTLAASSLDDPTDFDPRELIHADDAQRWHARAARMILRESNG